MCRHIELSEGVAEPADRTIAAQRTSGKSPDWRDTLIGKQHQAWPSHVTQADDPAVHAVEATRPQVST